VTYTALAAAGVALAVLLDAAVLRTRLVTRKAFWVSYAILLVFQLLTNGWLTGRGVVRYDGAAILGGTDPVLLGHWRVLWAPVEDVLFGFSLILQTLSWWVFWGRRGVEQQPARKPAVKPAGKLAGKPAVRPASPGATPRPPGGR
jgi:lycopene cyclase domain-containing protein